MIPNRPTATHRIRTFPPLLLTAAMAAIIIAGTACSEQQPQPTAHPKMTQEKPMQTIEVMAQKIAALQTKIAVPIQPADTAPKTSPQPTTDVAATVTARLQNEVAGTGVAKTSTKVPTTVTVHPRNNATWRGLTVAPEHRCSTYDSDDYRYPQSVERKIVNAQGGIYGPYTGTWFNSTRQTDIEHIVARSEAHDSGLCAASSATRKRFASDLLNLTLASPSINRHQKSDKDAAEWLPDLNQCWYVNRIVQIRLEYGLTIDSAEAKAIDTVLDGCTSTEMVVLTP